MSTLSQRLLTIALFLAVTFGFIIELYDLPDAAVRVDKLRESGLGYSSCEIPLTASEVEIYDRARVIKRFYLFDSQRFILVVVDGTRNRHAVHDPLYCFKGAGWKILMEKEIKIEGGKAMFLRMSKNKLARETIYWFSDGSWRHDSTLMYFFQTTLRRLTLARSGPEPVMVILQSYGNRPANWGKILNNFGLLFDL